MNKNYAWEVFNEYNSLDSLLKKLLGTDKGVTTYIDTLEKVPFAARKKVPEIGVTVSELKRLRHTRNRLAHEEGAFDVIQCKESDAEYLHNFHACVLSGYDPLGRLEAIENHRTVPKTGGRGVAAYYMGQKTGGNRGAKIGLAIFAGICIYALICLVIAAMLGV